MTRKHFEALAIALRNAATETGHGANVPYETVVEEVATVCAQFNAHFDRARFLAACGVSQ